MSISLTKGQKISLEKENGSSLNQVFLGLGWDTKKASSSGGFLGAVSSFFSSGEEDIDLDSSCLLFDQNNKPIDVIWFGKLKSKDGSIQHSGDNLTGEGEGDDETIFVNLNQLPAEVKSLIFTVNSFRGQTFENVANAFVRLVNQQNSTEIAKFNLSCQGDHTALVMCKLYRHDDEWKLHAIGEVANGRTFDDLMPNIVAYL